MSPVGQYGLAYIIFGLFGAGIVFGVAWLVTKILPFVGTVSFGSTTGWVLCAVGGLAGCTLAHVGIHGWRETWQSWVQWAISMVVIYVPLSIVGWYINANPDSALVQTGYDLVRNMPIAVWFAIPITIVVGMYAWAIYKTNRDKGRRR